MIPWAQAWQEALYGGAGFYRRAEGPAGHFTTAANGPTARALAAALAALARECSLTRVVDIGAGRGELLLALRAVAPTLDLAGVDVVRRPPGLPADLDWLTAPGGAALPSARALDARLEGALVVAHEWLDVVPCTVAEVDAAGRLRTVLVDPATGSESLGGPVTDAERAWSERWWPAASPGTRVEIGLSRDEAWRELLARARGGVAVAVDYGHTRADRPGAGTLIGYREGTPGPPVPDGTMDVTAHVAVDSLLHDTLLRQRDAVRRWGRSPRPGAESARTDPAGYLRGLAASSAAGALAADGLGDFFWAVSRTD